jgi:C-terminal processing protease CtpA/Prc
MKHLKTFLGLTLTICISACNKEEISVDDNFDPGTNEYVNDWIYTNLSNYYYWEEDLPARSITDANPEDFFYSQLSTQDRFSWIQPNFIELLNSLQGVNTEAGYEFILFNDPQIENGVIGQITYIKEGSPAATVEGILRGDLFYQINGSSLNINNYRSLLGEISEPHSLTFKRYSSETETFTEIGQKSFTTAEVAEKPIYLDTVYEINNKRIGYLVYNLFSTGEKADDDSYPYLQNMDAVFSTFKGKGIQHLILDLRYNSGGAETATINLASLIGAGITQNDVFIKRDYNDLYESFLIENYGEESLLRYFTNKAENIGSSLVDPELIVLTSGGTASASELLVNGLLPYMNVFMIGDTTVGKNVGSASIYEDDDPDNTYGMQPIITKSFNSKNQSDYSQGFYPDIAIRDFGLDKKELGDKNELLLNLAISYITGDGINTRTLLNQHNYANRRKLSSSQELKRSYGIYNIELEELLKDD